MRLLLWDSRSGDKYVSSTGAIGDGHGLGIDANWPIILTTSWAEFQNKIQEYEHDLCAVMVHISDAESIPDTITKADRASAIIKLLKNFASDGLLPIILFSGGGVDPKYVQAFSGYSGFVQSCTLRHAKSLLHRFGPKGDCSVFGVPELEIVLECLSGLWLVGLLWEKYGKDEADKGLIRTLESLYQSQQIAQPLNIDVLIEQNLELALQLKITGALSVEKIAWPPDSLRRAIFVLDKRIYLHQHASIWKTIHVENPPKDLDSVLAILKSAPGHAEYYERLTILRDMLLEE